MTVGKNESSVQPQMLDMRLNETHSLHASSFLSNTNLDSAIRDSKNNDQENANNYSKFIFSSPSATVTSNGPSVIAFFKYFFMNKG